MLSELQRHEFLEKGYFVRSQCLSANAMKTIRVAVDDCLRDREDPGRVNEVDGVTARAMHGTHLRNEVLAKLCRHPALLEMASGLLGEDVYVHQFKISVKAAFVGDVWEWHQDFTFYHCEDEVPEPRIVTVALFIDDVDEFNGPLAVIPSSHHDGFKPSTRNTYADYDAQSSWLSNTTAKLRYTVAPDTIRKLVCKYGLVAPKGRAGDAIVFHVNLFHCSGVNISPYDRRVIFISYNPVSNTPVPTRAARPEFLAARDHQPLTPCLEEILA